jgi:hypothetical protein
MHVSRNGQEMNLLSYRFFLELIVDHTTAYFIHAYDINIPKLAIEAVTQEIARQHDIRKVTQVRPVSQEIEDLKRALQHMRKERDEARARVQVPKPGLLARFRAGRPS